MFDNGVFVRSITSCIFKPLFANLLKLFTELESCNVEEVEMTAGVFYLLVNRVESCPLDKPLKPSLQTALGQKIVKSVAVGGSPLGPQPLSSGRESVYLSQ